MILDREFQHKILIAASEVYPAYTYPNSENNLLENSDQNSEKRLAANLRYLEEHQLLQPKSVIVSADNKYSFGCIQITNKGMDFLADDGGLSAILDVVTVKFHEDTIKDLLEKKILESELPTDRKQSMIDTIKSLPAEGVKQLALKLMDMGLAKLPDAMTQIAKYLGI